MGAYRVIHMHRLDSISTGLYVCVSIHDADLPIYIWQKIAFPYISQYESHILYLDLDNVIIRWHLHFLLTTR